VFTARYVLSPYIKQIRFVFKGLMCARVYKEQVYQVFSFKIPVCFDEFDVLLYNIIVCPQIRTLVCQTVFIITVIEVTHRDDPSEDYLVTVQNINTTHDLLF
jgi:hypothetical protein